MVNIITVLQELSRNGRDFMVLNNGWWQSSDEWAKKGNADKVVALFQHIQTQKRKEDARVAKEEEKSYLEKINK
jgi:deoxyribodipyrimidine photolyase